MKVKVKRTIFEEVGSNCDICRKPANICLRYYEFSDVDDLCSVECLIQHLMEEREAGRLDNDTTLSGLTAQDWGIFINYIDPSCDKYRAKAVAEREKRRKELAANEELRLKREAKEERLRHEAWARLIKEKEQ